MTYNPKISLTRINTKQQTLVSTLSLSKLMEKLTVNVRNEKIQYLRHHVQYDNGRYVGSRHHKLHRLYPSVRLCKGDDGQPHPAGYNDLLLLSAGPVREEEQLLLARETVEKGYSVRQLEAAAAERRKAPKAKAPLEKPRRVLSVELTELEGRIRETMGVRATLTGSEKKGRIVLQYYSREELEHLSELIARMGDQ